MATALLNATDEFLLVALQDGIATITINRPQVMNAMNEETVARMTYAMITATNDPRVKGIVIAGAGKHFVCGADVDVMLSSILSDDIPRIERFTHSAHVLMNTIEHCPKPVLARVQGGAIGGGLELALACHYILAGSKAAFALPETGLGIYPAGGGTQRTTRRIGVGLTKWLIFTGHMLPATDALAIGLTDALVPAEELDAASRQWFLDGAPRGGQPKTLSAEHKALASHFHTHDVNDLYRGASSPAGSKFLENATRRVATKGPLALKAAERMIDEGWSRSLAEGLQLEIDAIREVYSTEDALIGLTAASKRKPTCTFVGR